LRRFCHPTGVIQAACAAGRVGRPGVTITGGSCDMDAGSEADVSRLSARAGGRSWRGPRGRHPALFAVVCAAVAALVLAACSSSTTTAPSGSSATSGKVSGTVVVFAATSLTDAFDKIGAGFEKAHPGVTVKFNYNGSSSLATSINQG